MICLTKNAAGSSEGRSRNGDGGWHWPGWSHAGATGSANVSLGLTGRGNESEGAGMLCRRTIHHLHDPGHQHEVKAACYQGMSVAANARERQNVRR
jgi:hypothetical protein